MSTVMERRPRESVTPLLARALIVDTDPDTRLMYAEHLRRSMYQIDEADDGREALAKAIFRRPSVIVTETRLPGLSGLDLCSLLRADPATRQTPIIILTADAFPHEIAVAERSGADTVLVKPVLPERLAVEIAKLLARSGQRREDSRDVREQIKARAAASNEVTARASAKERRVLSHEHRRGDTREPPVVPPALVCPGCAHPLAYLKSHIGGVSARFPEQWDYFECATCRTVMEYRHRTRKLRLTS